MCVVTENGFLKRQIQNDDNDYQHMYMLPTRPSDHLAQHKQHLVPRNQQSGKGVVF
jgi:hypothetical protein